jgi:hypothetical protein
MSGRILIPGEVGSAIEPRLTLDGLRDMLQDMRRHNQRIPDVILVSEYDRRGLNQDLLGASVEDVDKEDQRPDHDRACIGVIEGVMVRSSPEIARGKARLVYPPVKEQAKPLPSGKLISLGAQAEPVFSFKSA